MAGVVYTVDFVAAIARLEEGTKAGARSVKRMADEIEGATNFARNAVMALAGALGVFSASAAIKQASEAADAAAKMGDRFGIVTEKMIGLQHAGQLAGASNEALATALRGLANSGIDAARGNEAASRAFATLGLNAREFINLPMDRQFTIVIERLGGLENATLRNAVANDVLGKSAGQVMGLVAEGGEAIRKATEDAEAWGLALNRVDAAKLEIANDALTRAKAAAQGFFTTIALQLVPAVKTLADGFADTAAEAGGFRKEANEAAETIVRWSAYAINAVQGVRLAWVGLKFAIAEVTNLAAQATLKITETAGDLAQILVVFGPLGGVAAIAVRAFAISVRDSLKETADWTEQNAARIAAELEVLAQQDFLDPEVVLSKFREVRAAIQEEAEAIAEARRKMMGGGEAGIEEPEKKPVKEDEWAKQVAQRMERLEFENSLEIEQLQLQLQAKSDLIDAARALGILTEEEHQKQLFIIIDKYAKAKSDVEEKYRQLEINRIRGALGAAAGLMQSHSRAAFNVGKVAAISLAVMDTYSSAVGVYQSASHIPYVGWIIAPIAAAGAIVAGMANVAKIRSTQFGGGEAASPVFSASPVTGIPTGSPGTQEFAAAPPPILPQPAAPERVTNISIRPGIYGASEIRDTIIPEIIEALADGVGRGQINIAVV